MRIANVLRAKGSVVATVLRDVILDCDDELRLRRAVPHDGVLDADLLAARLRPADVALRMRRRLVATRRPVLRRHLDQLRALPHLCLQSVVRRRPTVIADLEVDDDRLALRFEGKKLLFPPQADAAVRFCHLAAGQFAPADLAGLDNEGRMVLVRQLVKEGFLEVIEEG